MCELYGDKTPLPCCGPPPGVVGVITGVRATAATVGTTGDAENINTSLPFDGKRLTPRLRYGGYYAKVVVTILCIPHKS